MDVGQRFGPYEILGLLGQGADSAVFRARHDGRIVALKVGRPAGAVTADILEQRYMREAAILGRLKHPATVRVYAAGEEAGAPFIELELLEGEALRIRQARAPLSEAETVAIGRDLAAALGEAHRKGIVNCDVKPENVIVAPDGKPRLIDFGLALLLNGDATVAAADTVAGTFLYTAPEQSGVLRRPIDGRADLYALGIMLFELRAGAPPFASSDVATLMRMHAEAPVPSLHDKCPSASTAYVAVVERLLEKEPDRRFGTAEELVEALERIGALHAPDGTASAVATAPAQSGPAPIEDFALVARDAALKEIARSLSGARATQTPVPVVIEGSAGMGKSRICRAAVELARALPGPMLMFQARCQRGAVPPLDAIQRATHAMLMQVNALEPGIRQRIHDAFRVAAGDLAPMIAWALPELGPLLLVPGVAPPRQSDPEQIAEALALWVAALSTQWGGGILLVLDDADHADGASADVVGRLAARLPATRVAMTLACSAPAGAVQAEWPRTALEPLAAPEVGELAEAFCAGAVDDALSVTLHTKTGGVPMLVLELLRSMLEGGVLYPGLGGWRAHAGRLAALELPQNVADIAVRRLAGLSAPTRRALEVAAWAGNAFDAATVSIAAAAVQRPDPEPALAAATQAGVLTRVQAAREGGPAEMRYAFVSDQAAQQLRDQATAEERAAINFALAQALDTNLAGAAPSAELLLRLANHYAEAGPSLAPRRFVETNEAAGYFAAERNANSDAVTYFERALSVERTVTDPQGALTRAALGRAYQRLGRVEAAIPHLVEAARTSATATQRAGAFLELARAHNANFSIQDAWVDLESCFKSLGTPVSSTSKAQLIGALLSGAMAYVLVKLKLGRGSAVGARRERHQTFIRAAEFGSFMAMLADRPLVMVVLALRAMLPGHLLGESRESAFALVNFSTLMSVVFWKKPERSAYFEREALAMADRLKDPVLKARIALGGAWAREFRGEPVGAEQALRTVLTKSGGLLEAGEYWRGCTSFGWNLMLRGHVEEAYEWIGRARDHSNTAGASVGVAQGHPYLSYLASLHAILGRPHEAEAALTRAITVAEGDQKERYRWGHLLAHRLLYAVEQGESITTVRETINSHRQRGFRPGRLVFHLRHFYAFACHAIIARWIFDDAADYAADLTKAVEELRLAARGPTLCAHLKYAEGFLAWKQGDLTGAQRHLLEAERLSYESNNLWIEFEVAWQRARIAAQLGDVRSAEQHATVAEALARKGGWVRRAAQLRAQYKLAETSSMGTNTVAVAIGSKRQIETIMRVSTAAARSIDPREVARLALDELVKNLGAERGFLFLADKTGALTCDLARGAGGAPLSAAVGYSTTVVEKVRAEREALIISSSDEGELLGAKSVSVNNLRSIVAAPMVLNDQVIGVIYLDSRAANSIFSDKDLGVLFPIANQLAGMIEVARLAESEVARSILEKDLAISAEVQAMLLPRARDATHAKLQLAGFTQAATQCSGDYWWYGFDRNGACLAFLGDVTGHGAGPAMITAAMAGIQRALAAEESTPAHVEHLLAALHNVLKRLSDGRFLVAASAVLINPDGTTHLWTAGGLPVLHARADGTVVTHTESGQHLGGSDLQLGYEAFELAEGERLLLFTDGATELVRRNGRAVGLRGMKQLMTGTLGVDLSRARDTLAEGLASDRQSDVADDDVSFVLLARA